MHNTDSVLDISDFVESGKKQYGITKGFVAIRKGCQYMIKAFQNANLTEEEFEARKKHFKESFISDSVILGKKILPYLNHEQIKRYYELLYEQTVEPNIIQDDLNIADCIREFVMGPPYREMLGDDAPEIYLVKDDNDPTKIYLASKFIPNFTTVLDLRNNTGKYIKAEGYARILAAAILAGEIDIANSGNFGVITEKGKNDHFGKIDHGRSLYQQNYNFQSKLQTAIKLFPVRFSGIKIDTSELKSELKKQAKTLAENRENIELRIKERVRILEENLNPDLAFTLATTKFHYDKEKKHFISDNGKTLEKYFIAEFRRYKDRSNFLTLKPEIIYLGASTVAFAGGTFLVKFYEAKIIEKLGKELQRRILKICAFALCVSLLCIFLKIFYTNLLCKVMEGEIDSVSIKPLIEQNVYNLIGVEPSSIVTPTAPPEEVNPSLQQEKVSM